MVEERNISTGAKKEPPWIILSGLGLLLFGVLTMGIARDWNNDGQKRKARERVYGQVCRMADTDEDGRTSVGEWAQVYREVGVHFNEINPRELSVEEMRTYLETQNKDLPPWQVR